MADGDVGHSNIGKQADGQPVWLPRTERIETMMKDKDFKNMDEARMDETEVLNRPEDSGVGGEPEPGGKTPKVVVRPKDKAQRDILAAVAKARETGAVSSELLDEDVVGIVTPVIDALYDAYEEDGTIPTRDAFAERCVSEDVGNVVLAMGSDPFVARRLGRKAVAAICAGCVLALAVVCGGVTLALSPSGDEAPAETPNVTVTTDDEDEEENYVLSVGTSADGWDAETSSPVIVHVVSEELGVDYYHAYDANMGCQLPAEAGEYQLSFISPVNADGSIYRVPDVQTVQAVVSDDGQVADLELPYEFELVGAEDVTADELTAIVEQVTEAIKKGDDTLTGDAGAAVADKVEGNCAANPNADSEAVEEAGEEAEEASRAESAAQTGQDGGSVTSTGGAASPSGGSTSSSSGSGSSSTSSAGSTGGSGSGSSGGSGSSSSSSATHTHNWVAQTTTVHHDAVYKTVHHDAVYTTVHHDAVTEDRTICNNCGADITGNVDAHMKANILNGCGSYSIKTVVVQAAYDEQVLVSAAWDEQVLVSAAWDETVTTGYKCSGCGATK